MKIITNSARHGELYIDRIQELPKGLKKANPDGEHYVVAHSESGNSHVIDAIPGVNVYDTADPTLSYLEIIELTDESERQVKAILRHLKQGADAHGEIGLTPGIYELRRQSEADNTPKGWRMAAD